MWGIVVAFVFGSIYATGFAIALFQQARRKDQYLRAKAQHLKNGAGDASAEAFVDRTVDSIILAFFWPIPAAKAAKKWVLHRGRSR